MTGPETGKELTSAIEDSLIAGDELHGFKFNKYTFCVDGISEEPAMAQLEGYERVAVFGGFVLDSQESANFLITSEFAKGDSRTLESVYNVGSKGLEHLSEVGSRGLCTRMRQREIAELNAGKLAMAVLDSQEEPGGPLTLAAAVEVYEHPHSKTILPIFSCHDKLIKLALLARNYLPEGLHEFVGEEVKDLLMADEKTRMAFAVEAAADILPQDVSVYYRAEMQA